MKTLIKKIFNTQKTDGFNTQILENESKNDVVTVTKPVVVSYSKLPLIILKKLAPIRDFDDNNLQEIEQRTTIYAPESVIFILGEKNDKIHYLLKGRIEFNLNHGGSYTIDETSVLANLPINSGKVCSATATTKSHCTILSIPISVWYWWGLESKKKLNVSDSVSLN